MEVFAPDVTLGGCLSKYRRAFIVYMFRRPPEVWSLVSKNASISGTGKASIQENIFENVIGKLAAILSRPQGVNSNVMNHVNIVLDDALVNVV